MCYVFLLPGVLYHCLRTRFCVVSRVIHVQRAPLVCLHRCFWMHVLRYPCSVRSLQLQKDRLLALAEDTPQGEEEEEEEEVESSSISSSSTNSASASGSGSVRAPTPEKKAARSTILEKEKEKHKEKENDKE